MAIYIALTKPISWVLARTSNMMPAKCQWVYFNASLVNTVNMTSSLT